VSPAARRSKAWRSRQARGHIVVRLEVDEGEAWDALLEAGLVSRSMYDAGERIILELVLGRFLRDACRPRGS
jgi:hypothetical protein